MPIKTKNHQKKIIAIGLGLLILIILAGVFYWFTTKDSSARVTTTPTPKLGVQPKSNSSAIGQSGGIVATTSSPAVTPASSGQQPASSASGLITLDSPLAGTTITNGTTISGTAQVTAVNYLIKDNVTGVLAQGQLPVTNGAFSGTIQGIQPKGKTGEIEIYSTNSANGAAENDVQITVNYP